MSILHRMLLQAFLPVFVVAIGFFALVLQLVDLFPNLWRFTTHGVGINQIMRIAWLYLPTTIRYAVPIALLFAITYTLGALYARNEMIAVLGIGMSLRRFVSPLFVVGLIAFPALLLFDEEVGTRALRSKNELFQSVVNQRISLSNADVTVMGASGGRVYRAEYYNDRDRSLSGLMVVDRTADGVLVSRIDAARASWRGDRWLLSDVRRYRLDHEVGRMVHEDFLELAIVGIDGPDTFRRESRDVSNMTLGEGFSWVKTLRNAGLPYRSAQTDLYSKAAFALTPIVVSLFASAAGGLLRRNVLLASMLISLGCAVGYFVVQMLSHILAKSGLISPLIGASAAVIIFLVLGLLLLQWART